MKKIALLLSLVILPLSTGFAFDLFQDDKLQRIDDYRLTHRTAFEEIRSKHFQAAEFQNAGENKLYETNVNEGIEDLKKPGIKFGQDCINWKSCLRGAFWKTNGYNRSYQKKKIEGSKKDWAMYRNTWNVRDARDTTRANDTFVNPTINNLRYRTKLYRRNRLGLDTELSGKSKLIKLRNISATRGGQENRRNN